jgi:hypothetical protein
VTVYLSERDEKHDVTVLITNESGDTVFEKDYKLSDDNEADEGAPFPESTDLKTFVMTVDGTRFERDWPGFEHPELPCDTVGCNCLLVFRRPFRRNPEMTYNRPYEGQNWSGTEIWIENDQDGTPEVRIEAGCQHVTMD